MRSPEVEVFMNVIDAVGGGQTNATANGFSALSAEEFSRIIFTELSNQDPLAPNDTNALLQQISSIRSIQSNIDLSGKLETLVSQNEFAAAATLIGKTISGVDESLTRVTGVVKSLSRTAQGTVLTLKDGQRVWAWNVDEIREQAGAGE
jgi:flagellar basal-body rod modification protein FlgD